jgi:hypothetical protein
MAIISTPLATRADALSALSLIETGEDRELEAHLLRGLRVYLSAD